MSGTSRLVLSENAMKNAGKAALDKALDNANAEAIIASKPKGKDKKK